MRGAGHGMVLEIRGKVASSKLLTFFIELPTFFNPFSWNSIGLEPFDSGLV